MRTIIKGKQTELTPAIRAYIEAKIVGPATRLVGSSVDALLEIELSRTSKHHRKGNVWWAEANLKIDKHLIRAEEEGEDPHAVIDAVENELLREIKSFKGKKKTKDIRTARKIKGALKKL
ncbi:MAG: ribosome-associated translation inhibitor RaiA [Patescibacteria group bacterium]